MSFLLGTCVISELVKAAPTASVVTWLKEAEEESLFLSVLTLGELDKGTAHAADGARRGNLVGWVRRDRAERFRGRVLQVDVRVAERWGALLGESERRRIPLPVIDSLIAATSLQHDLAVVTRNTADMGRCGAGCINPWEGP